MPDKPTTRAELAVMMNAIMDYQVKAGNNYTDVESSSWYADPILKASAAGLLSGYPGGLMKPNQSITRQEAMIMLANVLELDTSNAPAAGYLDSSEIASWAQGAVNAMTEKGYIGGFDGKFRPNDPITRAEIAVIFTNIFSAYLSQPGTYTDNVDGNVVIACAGVNLKGQTITVAASPTPHAEILEVAKEILAAKGITLDIQVYNDYVVPNTVVDDGTLDANYFQHLPYLEDFNAENNTHIVSVSAIHVEPMGLYGGLQTSLDALKASK